MQHIIMYSRPSSVIAVALDENGPGPCEVEADTDTVKVANWGRSIIESENKTSNNMYYI